MATKLEKLENGDVKFVIEVDNKIFLDAEEKVYREKKGKFNIPGFRKGHATKDMIWKMYGREVFFEDAEFECINKTYYDEIKEYEKSILSKPEINVVQAASDKNFIYEATVAFKPDFTLGQYKGLELKKENIEVTDKEVEDVINTELDKNSRLVTIEDRPAKEHDFVTIDFDGFMNGERFEGGKSENFEIEIGSHTFIDGFEDQIIGKNIDEEFDVNVTFPENYGATELAGKPAVFKCKLHIIKEKQLPTFDDEFVSEISEFDKADDYKKDVKDKILKNKTKAKESENKNKLIDMVVNNTKFDLTDRAIEQGIDDIVSNMAHRFKHQGLSMEQYLKFIGKTMEEFRESQKETAIGNVKRYIILEELANVENIVAGDDLVDEYLEEMSCQYGESVEKLKEGLNENQINNIRDDMKYPAVGDFLYNNAKFV